MVDSAVPHTHCKHRIRHLDVQHAEQKFWENGRFYRRPHILPVIFTAILGFGKSEYVGPGGKSKTEE